MSKPEDIPQDIWDAAREVAQEFIAPETVARAIMAERERCAKIAGDYPTTRMIDGPQIATRIRKGTP